MGKELLSATFYYKSYLRKFLLTRSCTPTKMDAAEQRKTNKRFLFRFIHFYCCYGAEQWNCQWHWPVLSTLSTGFLPKTTTAGNYKAADKYSSKNLGLVYNFWALIDIGSKVDSLRQIYAGDRQVTDVELVPMEWQVPSNCCISLRQLLEQFLKYVYYIYIGDL